MDATQITKKTALFFAVALLAAGTASAAAPTLTVSTNSVTLNTYVSGGTAALTVSASDGTSAIPFTIAKNASWFSVDAQATTTGASPVTLTVKISGDCTLGAINCSSGSFTITDNGNAGDVQTVTVIESNTVPSGGGSGNGLLSSSQNPITLAAANGSYIFANPSPTIGTTSSTPIGVTIDFSPKTWLSVSPNSATINSGTPVALNVYANALNLSPNTTYTGSVTVTTTAGGGTTLVIPVSFQVGTGSSTSGSFMFSPNPVTLSYPSGTGTQSVYVQSGTASQFLASSDSNWLLVNGSISTTGTVNNYIQISVNPTYAAFLATNTYNGTITLTNSFNFSDTTRIPVILSVNGASGGTTTGLAAPSSLSFTYQQGTSPTPQCQSILVSSTGTFNVTNTGPFYTNTGTGGFTGPGTFQVCVAQFQSAGTQTGTLTLTSTGSGLFQQIPLSMTVSSSAVVNATVNGVLGDITCTYQAGVSGCNASTLSITASDNSHLPITVTPSAPWVTVTGSATETPGDFTVQLNPSGLANGMNTASISIAATGAANTPLTIPVSVFVSGNASTGNLTLSPTALTFTSAGSQAVNVTAATAMTFTASSGCNWLSVSPTSGTASATSQSLSVTVNSSGLTIGSTYSCNITLAAGGTTQTLPVSFTVPTASTVTLSADHTQLNFTAQQGIAPASQTVHITSTTGAAGATFNVTTDASWLTLTPSAATTPADITIGVNPAGLAVGSVYNGNVFFTPTGGNPIRVMVVLQITAATTVSAPTTPLTFSYIAGGATPASQTIAVTGTGSNLPFSAQVTSGSDWLSVSPATGTAPMNVTVSVNPVNLQANQTYNGTIVVAGTGTATGSTTINVSIAVTAPLPTILRITNGASFNTGSIAAGEIITLFGTAIGPATLTTAPSGVTQFPTTLGGVQVTVGGYLAPLIYVRNDQVAAIVPYEINRPFIATPAVVLRFLGQSSNGVNLSQAGTAPGIFTVGGGSGQGAILNQNLSVNSAGNPANKGEVIVLYVTGEGQTTPAGVTGKVTPVVAPFPQPVSGAATVTIDGQPAQVLFYGEAPGLVAGVMQINVLLPSGVQSGDRPVVVTVGGASSQTDARGVGTVTVAVR